MHGLEELIAGRVAPGVRRWEISPEELFRTARRPQRAGLTRTPDGRLALPLAMGGGHADVEAPPWLVDAEDAGWEVFGLGESRNEEEFLANAADVLEFPEDSDADDGDAFYDLLTDMEWLPAKKGYLIVWPAWRSLAEAAPETFFTVMDIFRDAVDAWAESDTPMHVLLPASAAELQELKGLA
ncbi:barstar family protein [Actinocorallia sp. B10E7]|uniref:barstar family protein n=1 Tax=Actinocorallia sp. B10E7 TaxID=3153558 RepID=UPI00325DB6A5